MEFDYSPFESDVITVKRVNEILKLISSPENASTWGLIKNCTTLVLMAMGMFVLWRLEERAIRKHKQAMK